jgi:hypothetical protein
VACVNRAWWSGVVHVFVNVTDQVIMVHQLFVVFKKKKKEKKEKTGNVF